MAGALESAAVADLLVFFEPLAAAAVMEELLLPIVQKWKLGRATMAGCNFEEDDGSGRMGKSSELFLFILAL
jgi:hypothetical protein